MSQKLDFGKIKEIQNPTLQQLGRPHVDSFNYMTNGGLEKAVADLDPAEFQLNDDKIKIEIEAVAWSCPTVPHGTPGVNMTGVRGRVYPKECRLRAVTYKGKFMAKINWYVNGELRGTCEKDMGNLPVMVKSNRCNLNFMSPEELVKRGEHENEWGGYFVVKGHERLIRMLVMNRRHFPIAMRRNGWKNRGENFSDMGIQIRCVQDDQTATTNVLHYVNDGTVKLMFMHKKACYFAPLILIMKCIGVYADFHIYEKLIAGFEDDMYFVSCVENMLRALHTDLDLHTTDDCRNYLGKMFRVKLLNDVPEWYTDRQIAAYMLKRCVLVHLKSKQDKLNMLVYMTQKLFAFAQNKCVHEGADSVMMQEVLMGGHLYLMAMKEKLQGWLRNVKLNIKRQAGGKPAYQLTEAEVLKAVRRAAGMEQMMEMFLATGNLKSMEGSGLMQNTGLTIVAENINRMRYMSHFRSIHRGAFFQEMRTTEVRRLLPDAWGFICPVHTPDGAPCGLLNHLTMDCVITDVPDADKVNNIKPFLVRYGLRPVDESNPQYKECLTVLLDGRVLGHLPDRLVSSVVGHLRKTKIEGEELPQMLEIALVTKEDAAGQFPGLYLFTGPARMMRPVVNLSTKTIEYIGTFEQVYMEVAVSAKDFKENLTTHMEISQIGFLSNLARLIPLPDYNQSPRNMYQCQMGKQSMGTPCHNWRQQSAGKLYRLQTPQSPLFKPQHYDDVDMDDFAMGSNAIIAVMCDTGYDMEDAMVINKMSEERGLAHGSIQKSDLIVLDSHVNSYFFRDRHKPELCQYLDNDGLPFLGRKLVYGEPYYCYYNAEKDCHTVKNFAGKEECIVDSVMLIGTMDDRKYRSVRINVIVPRNPSVGDKFASRAGQKGICSQKWPMENLPFTETGMVPDIVFNPHGFPSRMTIAMMIEVMAGKSACVHGTSHDATPFRYSQEGDEEEEEGDTPTTAMEYFARQLEQAGYNYYGTETMYSGISGEELKTQIFFGMVHYQRLRHMVSDKWQVRSTGPIDTLTKQPLKGRRRGGGVRFGEMERDALLSHGASYLLQDRLFLNSDKCVAHVCMSCNNMMGTTSVVTKPSDIPNQSECKEVCFLCRSHDNVQPVFVPYIFLYFQKQLTMLGITLVTELKEV